MPAQQLTIFILKRDDAVMFLLALNITHHLWHHGFGDGETAIACLPMELSKQPTAFLNPTR
jgi:hypothetical protein